RGGDYPRSGTVEHRTLCSWTTWLRASLRVEPDLISRIKEAQKEDSDIWTIVESLDKQVKFRLDDDNVLWQDTRLVVPNDASLREALLTEAHSSPFFVKIEHLRASGLLQPLDIPVWKWDEISMDFVTGLPRTQRRHDAIWVVVDRLTKSAHFLPIRKDYSVSRLAETFQQEIVRLHGTPSAIVSDRDPRLASRFLKGLQKAWGTRLKFSTAFHPQTDGQTERTIQTLEDMLRSCALEWTGNWDDYICLVQFAYNNSWHASIKCAPFKMLYGRKCRAPICWDQVGECVIEGPEMIEVTNKKVVVAKEKLKEARTRQKSYANKHRKSLEFQPGDHVFLKVSPARGVRRFGIKGKLSPHFIGPFEILDRVGEVSYHFALPPQLSHVYNVFHVSLLRGYKYHHLRVISYPLDQIQYVAESDPEEDPKEYEDDETKDGPVDYLMDGGDDGDDDDGDSFRDGTGDEDEEEEEHLASAESAVVIPIDELVSPPREQSLSYRHPSLTLDDIPETEMTPRKRLCLSTLGSRYEVEESFTARPTEGRGIDYGFVNNLDAEARRREIREVGVTELAELYEYNTQDLYALLEDAHDSRTCISQRADVDSQQVDLLMEDMIAHQETIQIVEDETYDVREAWVHSIGLSQAVHYELQTHQEQVNTANTNNANNQRGTGLGQKTTCYECGVQGRFRRECPKLKNNNNHGNQGERNNAPARVYAVGCAGTDPDANVVTGHFKRDYPKLKSKDGEKRNNGANPKGNGCFECGAIGHFKRDCPKLKSKDGEKVNAPGWVYVVGNAEKRGNASRDPDSNVVTGNSYDVELVDGKIVGVDTIMWGCTLNFLSHPFNIDLMPVELGNSYDVELVDGKIVGVDTIMWGCTLNFLSHPFNIDLMPVELGIVGVIIGMDWLRRCHVVIVCDEKLVRIPYGNETLTFRGNESNNGRESRLTVISCSKAQEYMEKGCQIFLAHISAKKEEGEGKQLEDVPVVRDYPEGFPKDFLCHPQARPVEFQIDLIPGAAPTLGSPGLVR
nr:putative nucleotidyltransferase, ribonuclease H [Tanacetum cinerariifolium]